MKIGICKLCLQKQPLIGKSHIYPQFIYKGVFDNSNRTVFQNLKAGKDKFYQTGFFDRDILCQHCDNVILGSLERYAASILYNPISTNGIIITETTERPELKLMHLKNINYKKFKLFVLSLLWKAHISSNAFFREVNVSAIEPHLRSMILNQDLFEDESYQLCVIRIDRPNGKIVDVIPNPQVSLDQILKVAIFIIGGLVYAIELEQHSNFSMFPEFSLKKTNEIIIPRLSLGVAQNFLKAMGLPDKHANYYSGVNI